MIEGMADSGVTRVSVGEGRYRIELVAVATMEGLIVVIGGGEKSHVGATAIAVPGPSLKDPTRLSVTTSIFTLLGHKDNAVAKPAAEIIARELGIPVVVVAGIHIERARSEEIEKLTSNATEAVQSFLKSYHHD